MKNIIKSVAVFALLAFAGTTFAQNSASDNASANATVICKIQIAKVTDLNFGKIVSSPTGSATVTPAGTETYGDGSSDPGASGHGTQTAAQFHVTGQGGQSYSITHTLPTQVVSGANSMALSFTAATLVGTGTLGLFPGEGCTQTQDYTYGGTVTEGAGQAPGSYSASWTETVTYN